VGENIQLHFADSDKLFNDALLETNNQVFPKTGFANLGNIPLVTFSLPMGIKKKAENSLIVAFP